MFRPPLELMFHGTFHYAKVHAATQDQFLLVNLQAATAGPAVFASFAHNRDLWADDAVKQTVKDNWCSCCSESWMVSTTTRPRKSARFTSAGRPASRRALAGPNHRPDA
jgi:hypothetical protein